MNFPATGNETHYESFVMSLLGPVNGPRALAVYPSNAFGTPFWTASTLFTDVSVCVVHQMRVLCMCVADYRELQMAMACPSRFTARSARATAYLYQFVCDRLAVLCCLFNA